MAREPREPSTPRILIESDRPARALTPPATAPASSDVGLSLSLSLGESRRDFRPATSERASLRLVEQTKIDDPDKFKIWDEGGRANTPISFWKEERQYEAAAEQAFGTSSTPWSNLSHRKVRAMQEKGHMRALLLGPSQGSTSGLETPRDLNGLWISTDGELRGEIEGDVLRWDCDGSRSRLQLAGERQEIVSLAVDGCRHFGALSEDGRRLLWADGDVWVRHDQEAQALAKVVRDQCGGGWQPQPQPPNDCELEPQKFCTQAAAQRLMLPTSRPSAAGPPVGGMPSGYRAPNPKPKPQPKTLNPKPKTLVPSAVQILELGSSRWKKALKKKPKTLPGPGWSKWKLRWRPNSDGPAWPRPRETQEAGAQGFRFWAFGV